MKPFASQADTTPKKESLTQLADGVYAYTAEGDPNAGVIVGDNEVLVVDALATPVQAKRLIKKIRSVTDKKIKYVVLSHYHAVRVLGASAFKAQEIICSQGTYELIVERGQQDFTSEVARFPRLFTDVNSVPQLTYPTMTFSESMTLWLGQREVHILHLGHGHTKGDTVVWLPKEKILFAGDLVEMQAAPYCGDAYLNDWPQTLEKLAALKPRKLVPGRGPALVTPFQALIAINNTKGFVRDLIRQVRKGIKAQFSLGDVFALTNNKLKGKYGHWVIYDHCIPFSVARAYDELNGVEHPRIWTEQRDQELWQTLQSS